MPKPLRISIDFLSYEGTITNDPQDAISIKRKVEESNVSEVSRLQTSIPASTSNQSIQLPDSSTDYLLLFIDRELRIKLNGSSDVITFYPKTPGTKCPVFFIRGNITALSVTNPSSTDAVNLDFIAVNI